jgi:hypothetical protein
MVVKCGGSVIVGSDPIFLSNCFPISILNPVRVLSMAFTSFTFAFILAFVFVNASSFLTFTSFPSLFLLFSLLKFCFLYWQWFPYLLSLSLFEFSLWWWSWFSLSLLLFEERFSPGEVFCLSFCFSVAAVSKEHIGGYRFCDQSHNGVLFELLRRGLVFFGNFVR